MFEFECQQYRTGIVLRAGSCEDEPVPLTELKLFVKISPILHLFSSFPVQSSTRSPQIDRDSCAAWQLFQNLMIAVSDEAPQSMQIPFQSS